ncbi:probable disease resistance protein At4g27220 [Aristolochia californica]|uniref:probable disease resistance protein At4g27220 n=1 Tax=Aristolochia californica TaxID=171875 RepID=UPI0035DC0EB8
MEVLASVIVAFGKYLTNPIKRNCSYLFHFRRKILILKNEKEDLVMMKTNIQCLIDEAQQSQEEILEEVNDWMQDVAQITSVIERLNEEADENKTCLMGQCPNFSWRYQLGRKGERELDVLQRLKHRGDLINRVSRTPFTPAVEPIRTLDNAEELERGKSLLGQIKEVLCDNNISSIGIHGMGGIGKTTLMKSLNNVLQGTQLFNKVVMVTVSGNPDLMRIQQQIADRLDIRLDPHSFNRRANQLAKALREQQKVLIILDDVWKKLETYELGIPSADETTCCKIIIASRIKTVCQQMNMEKILAMKVLSETDSWNLFKSTTGDVALNRDLLPLAKQIVGECKGSPLAIVTIGSVLRGQENVSEWHGTLIKLRSPETSDQEGIMGEVIQTIRVSYDHLRYEDIRKCFLFCCLFSEDDDIPMDKLLIYGTGEGFLKSNNGNLSDNWKLLEFYVENLKNHNLLLNDEGEESLIVEGKKSVRLHDVVRETGKLIAQNNEYGFVSKAGLGLSKCPILDMPQECKHVSLMDNKITLLSEWPECPKLRSLLLQNNNNLEVIPETFFEGMPKLLVLDLSSTRLKMLPLSLACIRNLRTLVLDYCTDIRDISAIGCLKQLEILSVKYTGIKQLQKELAELTTLKFLDLRGNYYLKKVAPGVLSQMVNLQVLYMWGSLVKWDGQGKGGFKNASFTEVASLHCLTDLYLFTVNANCLSMVNYWQSLQKFDVLVDGGGCRPIPTYDKAQIFAPYSKTLQLFSLSYPFLNWVNYLIERTEVLLLNRCTNLKSLPSFVSSNSYLVHLEIDICDEMEYLLDADEIYPNGFASLKEIHLQTMVKLEKICQGPLPNGFLRHLQILEVWSCEKLIFQLDHIQALRSLEVLTVDGCHEMEHLIDTTEAQSLSTNILECLKKLTLRNMKKITKLCHGPLPSRFLTTLQVVYIQNCKQMTKDVFSCSQLQNLEILENIFLEGIDEMAVLLNLEGTSISPNVFQNLKTLHIVGMNKIKEVVHGLFPIRFVTASAFHNLELLYISNCNVLRSLFAISVALHGLKKLNRLMIHDCKQMEVVLEDQEEGEFALVNGVLPKLTYMWLENLPELKSVCNKEIFPCFPVLETIVVLKCPKLKRLPLKHESLDYLKAIHGGCRWFESLLHDMALEEEAKSLLKSLFKVHWREADGEFLAEYI